jgi:hypothetical protein
MAGEPPAPDPRVIAAFLDDVDLELDAARRLVADPPNRLAAFHLQQAAAKLVKAVRLRRRVLEAPTAVQAQPAECRQADQPESGNRKIPTL